MKTLDPRCDGSEGERDGASIMGAGAARALEATGSGDADNGSACEGRGSGHMASADTVTSTGRAAATTGGAAAATGRVAAAITGRVAAAKQVGAAAATGMAGTTGTGGMSYCGVAEADGADERAVGEGITDADWDWEYGIVGGWMVDDEAAA